MNINIKEKIIGKTSKESLIMMWTILEMKQHNKLFLR
jgi:hypothetical protein